MIKKAGVYWLAILIILVSGGYALAGESPPEVKVNSTVFKVLTEENKLLIKSTPDHRHWVYHELAGFKQSFVPVVQDSSGRVTEAEKKILQGDIFNAENLDKAIEVKHWALLLRIVLSLPEEKTGQLLDMYVFSLASGNKILREDAAGGMVKLLTGKYLSGSASAAELEKSKALVDLLDVSEKQKVLVQMAYREGIVDGTVRDFFRPKEELTNAEAVSMLYRVITRYKIELNDRGIPEKNQFPIDPKGHWAGRALNKSMERASSRLELLKRAQRIIQSGNPGNQQNYLEQPIPVERWNDLIMETLAFPGDKYPKSFLRSYTYGLSEGKYITRGSAVAGMVKLLHAAELVRSRDATEEEKKTASKSFDDYGKAWDQSKFAIAYKEGLIMGYGDHTFRPEGMLTNGEGLALVVKIIEKYY